MVVEKKYYQENKEEIKKREIERYGKLDKFGWVKYFENGGKIKVSKLKMTMYMLHIIIFGKN